MEDILKGDDTLRYMMLGRFQRDCEYYLGFGGRSKEVLWCKDEKQHIANMKAIYDTFDDQSKPQWLTWEQILAYEKQLLSSC